MKPTKFFCETCSVGHAKWQGQCSACKSWNSIEARLEALPLVEKESDILSLNQVQTDRRDYLRIDCPHMKSFFHKGVPKKSVFILSGQPGVGKSSFVDFLAKEIGERSLYLIGEESKEQVADRLKRHEVSGDITYLSSEVDVGQLRGILSKIRPEICIIDSFQTLKLDGSRSRSSQTEMISILGDLAFEYNVVIWIVAHVNKQGNLAGLKYIEHMVDGVFTFQMEKDSTRKLIASKNRFGRSDLKKTFSMQQSGLTPIFCEKKSEDYIAIPGRVFFPSFDRDKIELVRIDSMLKPENYNLQRDVLVGIDGPKFRFMVQILSHNSSLSLKGYSTYIRVERSVNSKSIEELALLGSLMSSLGKIPFDCPLILAGAVDVSGSVLALNLDVHQKEKLHNLCQDVNGKLVVSIDENFAESENVVSVKNLEEVEAIILKKAS